MVSRLDWAQSYRIIPSRYPIVGLFDAVSDPADIEIVATLEAATNPRVLDELGTLTLVRPEERIAGPGTTVIMGAFTHTRPSRFSDGSFGVYYAGNTESTAVAETVYQRTRFLRDAALGAEIVEMRVYTAAIGARVDDLRRKTKRSKLYDPDSYEFSARYAYRLYRANAVDGIVYRSVRRPEGECVAVFRPRCIKRCRAGRYLQYHFDGERVFAVTQVRSVESLFASPDDSRSDAF